MTDDKKKGWFQRLTQGLSRTSTQLTESVTQVFQQKEALDDAALEELEDLLVESDLGPQIAATIAEAEGERRAALRKASPALAVGTPDESVADLLALCKAAFQQKQFGECLAARQFRLVFVVGIFDRGVHGQLFPLPITSRISMP